jgi:anti-anti-sigma factor
MSPAIHDPLAPLVMKALESLESPPAELNSPPHRELVRGHDGNLLARIEPLLHDRSVSLDLDGVERIDAAGITALVYLYQSAVQSGHSFSVTNVPARVERILQVVGLDHVLMSHNAVQASQYGHCTQRSAA